MPIQDQTLVEHHGKLILPLVMAMHCMSDANVMPDAQCNSVSELHCVFLFAGKGTFYSSIAPFTEVLKRLLAD